MRIVYFHIFRRNVSISFLRGHVFEDFAWSRPDIEQKRKWNLCAHGNCRQELRVSSYGIFSAYFPLRFYYLQRYGRIRTSIHVFRVTKLAATIYLRVGECTELFSSGLSKTWENKEMSNKQTNKQTNRANKRAIQGSEAPKHSDGRFPKGPGNKFHAFPLLCMSIKFVWKFRAKLSEC